MTYKLVTATIDSLKLDEVESKLREIGIPGISVSTVKGYGTYKNFYQRDWLESHARIQIYVEKDRVPAIVQAIAESASTGSNDDGIIAVTSVDTIYNISDMSEVGTRAENT